MIRSIFKRGSIAAAAASAKKAKPVSVKIVCGAMYRYIDMAKLANRSPVIDDMLKTQQQRREPIVCLSESEYNPIVIRSIIGFLDGDHNGVFTVPREWDPVEFRVAVYAAARKLQCADVREHMKRNIARGVENVTVNSYDSCLKVSTCIVEMLPAEQRHELQDLLIDGVARFYADVRSSNKRLGRSHLLPAMKNKDFFLGMSLLSSNQMDLHMLADRVGLDDGSIDRFTCVMSARSSQDQRMMLADVRKRNELCVYDAEIK